MDPLTRNIEMDKHIAKDRGTQPTEACTPRTSPPGLRSHVIDEEQRLRGFKRFTHGHMVELRLGPQQVLQ